MTADDISGPWNGKLSGTHHGSIQLEVKQSGSAVTLRAQISDNEAGRYGAVAEGTFVGDRLEVSSSGSRAGRLSVVATVHDADTMQGQWRSSFGSGDFTATRARVIPTVGESAGTPVPVIPPAGVFTAPPAQPIPPVTNLKPPGAAATSERTNGTESQASAESEAGGTTDEPVNSMRVGTPASIRREACNGEAANGIDRYARAIARYFEGTEGEFSFALFGPWGRGKTFLMTHVAQELQRRGYATVHFSAWKYKKPPLLWASLYSALADRALGDGFWGRQRLRVRVFVAKRGLISLLPILLVALFALMPLSVKVDIVQSALGSTALLATVIFVVKTVVAARTVLNRIDRAFSSGYGHLLGLQESIGKELKALLVSWIASDGSDLRTPAGLRRKTWRSWVPLLAVLSIASYFLTPWSAGAEAGWSDLESILGVVSALVFVSIGGTTWWLTNPPSGQPQKVLLIVDDLDRCSAQEMLDAIESLMLFLQDPTVNDRMSIAMLVEEKALRSAIKEKHEALELSERDVTNCVEKLFLTHLRLLPLSEFETLNVFIAILENSRAGVSLDALAARPEAGPGIRTAANFREEWGVAVSLAEAPEKEAVSEEELMALLEKASVISQKLCQRGGAGDCEGGPRAVRALYHRYMLARCLLEELGYDFVSSELAEHLAAEQGSRDEEARRGMEWKNVLAQVV